MAVHTGTAAEEDVSQAQTLQYNVEMSAQHCPVTPMGPSAILSWNNHVAPGITHPDGILPHKYLTASTDSALTVGQPVWDPDGLLHFILFYVSQ